MGKMKSLLEFFVEIEPEESDEVPEEAASDDPDVAAKAAAERAQQGAVGKKPSQPRKVGEMAGDPYAGMVDEAALSDATSELSGKNPKAVFDKIYQAAGLPPRGANQFTIHKVERLLHSEHLSGLSDEVKQRSIMVTLESSNKSLDEVIQDAVARDKALDQYDGMLRKEVGDLEKQVKQENARIEKEIEEYLERKKAQIKQNKEKVDKARRMYEEWSSQKENEEERLFNATSVFVDKDNPVTKGMGDWEDADPSQFPDADLFGGDGGKKKGKKKKKKRNKPEKSPAPKSGGEPSGDAGEMSEEDKELAEQIEALEENQSDE